MEYRVFGRLGWMISEIGHGTWGMGGGEHGWTGSDNKEAIEGLDFSISLGCNFIDTAWIYGRGNSEVLVGKALKNNKDKKIYVATKVPPKDMNWPAKSNSKILDVYPNNHIEEYVSRSLENLDLQTIDLLQFHVWQDSWSKDDNWKIAVENLKRKGYIKAIGISINTWEPTNVLETLKTDLIDSVQVIYNIFEQAPEDVLIPYCNTNKIAVIARVPFDEGSLIGNLTLESKWPDGDWRNSYFVKENLEQTIPRLEKLKNLLPKGKALSDIALRFVLSNESVSTVIPGMRKKTHIQNNINLSGNYNIDINLFRELKKNRWDRLPTFWSQ